MLIDRNDISQMHQRIIQSSAASPDAITVLILVAVDTDAVAAAAMLTVHLSTFWHCAAGGWHELLTRLGADASPRSRCASA